jgi:hypothetical protein
MKSAGMLFGLLLVSNILRDIVVLVELYQLARNGAWTTVKRFTCNLPSIVTTLYQLFHSGSAE